MNTDFDLLLAGAGHSHLGALRQWASRERPLGRIGLISAEPHAWYSGMMPGLIAERYQTRQCRIALPKLCAAAEVEFIQGTMVALLPETPELLLATGETLRSTWLSLNLGSLPWLPEQSGDGMELLSVKPFADFIRRWQQWQEIPEPLAILGGGAAGVELALAMAGRAPAIHLFSDGELLTGHPPRLRRLALRQLQRADVQVYEQTPIQAVHGNTLIGEGQIRWQGRRLVVATGPSPLEWLRESGLRLDARGFVEISSALQSRSHPHVFASGDCASLPGAAHNGVHAVRQAAVLATNLGRAAIGQPLRHYHPPTHSLALLADGQRGALLSWGSLAAEGRLLGRWKDHIDRRFMRRHGGVD
ncbi:pyridine nucleotide-disulfide oxidoreductase [Stutzerimonas stutzeri]|uniref:Pyridine nucleotide-disulfide oxidoreductase n=1 Tax=Stutzerimonas stutzeri TaxID=316 RepID=W8RYX4_STUST|nr:FAD-dependent oxidoreductase [Stutzerimonas stutzeri]AHL77331.1 pyridine nucleotide-disulfide oxidoreductase [Stutzerimonas stutzeri]MCQ4330226.1 FAD-dependent oxidoreductase [Stutzerimonas stutzeri]